MADLKLTDANGTEYISDGDFAGGANMAALESSQGQYIITDTCLPVDRSALMAPPSLPPQSLPPQSPPASPSLPPASSSPPPSLPLPSEWWQEGVCSTGHHALLYSRDAYVTSRSNCASHCDLASNRGVRSEITRHTTMRGADPLLSRWACGRGVCGSRKTESGAWRVCGGPGWQYCVHCVDCMFCCLYVCLP